MKATKSKQPIIIEQSLLLIASPDHNRLNCERHVAHSLQQPISDRARANAQCRQVDEEHCEIAGHCHPRDELHRGQLGFRCFIGIRRFQSCSGRELVVRPEHADHAFHREQQKEKSKRI